VRARLVGLLLVSALSVALTACGSEGSPSKPAPGTPENPLVAKPSTADVTTTGETGAEPGKPGYAKLVERQREKPVQHDRDNPCALVTKRQAQTILGAKLLDPVVAPQGPTCVYRDRASQRFATIAIQSTSFSAVRRQLRRVQRVDVSDRTAYCGMNGRPMLYLPLSGGRVLSVASQCDTAARLARRAASRLRP